MKKNKTKSILACAVLASVLAGGFASAEAAQVNSLVGPKDFAASGLIGKDITFGQKRGYSNNTYDTSAPEKIAVFNEQPTWQIIAVGNDVATLLAKECWGINRYSDNDMFQIWGTDEASVAEYYCREVLNCLNNKEKEFFSLADLSVLASQTSVEMWNKRVKYEGESGGENKYTGIFALPVKQILEKLSPDQIKRSDAYWLNDSRYVSEYDSSGIPKYYLYYKAGLVGTDGNISEEYGQYVNKIYPVLQVQSPMFAYYGNKQQAASTFKKQLADSSRPLHLAVKNTQTENDVQITSLDISAGQIKFTADGLATGTGQGLAGILADNDGNYVAYARFAETTENSKVDNVTITDGNNKFLDNSQFAAGNYTVYLFNEKLSADPNSFDYVSNFDKFTQVSLNDDGTIAKFTLFGKRVFSNLIIPQNLDFVYSAKNIAGSPLGSWYSTECEAVTVTDNFDWPDVLEAQGNITLKGIFSVEDGTLKLVRPTNTDPDWRNGIEGWNDITYSGTVGQNAVLHVNGNMHGLVVNGGTFTAEKDLSLSDYLQVNNGSKVIVKGNLTAADMQLSNNAVAEFVGGKNISISNSLKMSDGANLKATGNGNSRMVANSVDIKGSTGLENINLETNDLSVDGNLNLQGNLTIKKSLKMQNDKADSMTVNNFIFGEGNIGEYYLDLGSENFTINGKATGNVKLNFNYNGSLQDKEQIEVFKSASNSTDLTDFRIQPVRITDKTTKQTYLLTQDTTAPGKMNVNVAQHNTAVIFADRVVAGQKVYFGNYWQSDTNGDGKVDKTDDKQKILWDVVANENGVTTLFSEKVLQKSTEVYPGTRADITIGFFKDNFDYHSNEGAWIREAFSEGEAKLFGYKLCVPTLEQVNADGTFNLTEEQRRASGTAYSGASAYGLANAYEESDPVISGRKKFYLYQINNQGEVIDNNSPSPGIGPVPPGIRPVPPGIVPVSPGIRPVPPGIRPVISSNGPVSLGIRPIMYFDGSKSVLFATNAENGKGSVGAGGYTRLKPVDNNSTLELTFDDAYVHSYTGQERKTGDISIDRIMLNANSVQLRYTGAKYVDDNSYISYFVGDGNLSQDYLGYGKSEVVDKSGNGFAVVRLKDITDANDTNGYALTLFNEYDKGTSMAGALNIVPGSFTLDSNGNTNYTIKGNATLPNLIVGIFSKFTATGGILTITDKLTINGIAEVDKIRFAKGSTLVGSKSVFGEANGVLTVSEMPFKEELQGINIRVENLSTNDPTVVIKVKPKLQAPLLLAKSPLLGSNNDNSDLFESMTLMNYGAVIDPDRSVFTNEELKICAVVDPELSEYCDISNIVEASLRHPLGMAWWETFIYDVPDDYWDVVNNAVNTFGNLNSLANVQGGLRTMSSLVTDSIQENAGLRIEEQGARENVWASYIHSKEKIEGRKTGHLQQNSTLQYNGIVVGADLWSGEHGFGGVALHYADGSFHSYQMVNTVKNEADYYGISVYNRQDVGKFNFICNGGFTYGKNDITVTTVEMEDSTANPRAWACNLGFRVEEPVALSGATTLTPFAGARYTFIKTKDYKNDFGMEYAADNQHLLNIPVGLTLKGTYETKEGWTLGGSLTGGYNWNLGNRNSTQTVSYYGCTDSIGFDVADRGGYFVKAALTAEHKNLAFEMGYRYSKGSSTKNNRWYANMNFRF